MENDLSLSQAFGGLRIANPDHESLPGSPTEACAPSQSVSLNIAASDYIPDIRRASIFKTLSPSRGPSDTESCGSKLPLQTHDYRLSQHYTNDGNNESFQSPLDPLHSTIHRAGFSNSSRKSLPNCNLANPDYQFLSHDSYTKNINENFHTEELLRFSSGIAAQKHSKSSSIENIDPQRSHLPVTPTKTDSQGNIFKMSGLVNSSKPEEQEQLYDHNYSTTVRAGSVSSRIGMKGVLNHVEVGGSTFNGTITPRPEMEGYPATNNEILKDREAMLGAREDYRADEKPVPRQMKKGVRDFIFGQLLGEGSYSQVVLGTDKQTLKEYAVKILDKNHIIKEKKVKYVNIEKDTLNRLTEHPGIVRLYYTFQDTTSLYYVLDIASGGELLGVLKKTGSFDEECTRFYGAQILDAVEHIHNRGVIHRDLKPENVLLDHNMHIKITDFGTAKLLPDPRKTRGSVASYDTLDNSEEYLRARSFVGTAEYVSPELLTEKSACKASDLWAFGCIIYQLLTGRPPFKAGNDYLTFQKIVHLEFEYPPGFPSIARDLVDRLLVLDPQKRLTIEHIKAHLFFEGTQWGRGLWKQKAPRLKPFIPPSQEPRIIKLNRQHTNICPATKTPNQQSPSPNDHSRPQPRVITELPPPTQLDIEWSPILTRNNERILKLGNLTVISSPFPLSPHSRNGEHGDGHEKKKLLRFFGGTHTKKRQRLVIITSSARIIIAAAGGEQKRLKAEISLWSSECTWRTQIDSKGHEVWCVYTNGMHYTFEDTKNSVTGDHSFKSSAPEWIESIEHAKELALSQSAGGSCNSDGGFELMPTLSSSTGTLIASSVYSESTSMKDRTSRGNLTKSQPSLRGDDAEHQGKKSRFSKRQSKNGMMIPF